MIKEVRYDTLQKDIDYISVPSIFLAGPTVRGHQTNLTSWRFEAIEIFKENGFEGNLIIPEFDEPQNHCDSRTDLPLWEFESMRQADCIMFWIPRTKELIGLTTNYEIGYWTCRCRERVVYGRPDDAYRISYLDTMWNTDLKDRLCYHEFYPKSKIHNTLSETVKASIELCKLNYAK